MELNGLASFGWREALIIISVILAIYIVYTFLRLQGLKRQESADDSPQIPVQTSVALAAYEEAQSDLPVEEDLGLPISKADKNAWYEPPVNQDVIDLPRIEELERELVLLKKDRKRVLALEQELAQFRKEVGGLRAEIMVLRESISKTPRIVSPHYNDAMQMALQGHDADAISQHCGISRAEADLVTALARHQD